ncbi:SRPBCC family protein [Paenibacillus sp. Y412MC10]|uniref:SRPBCC family protein n=1 Tax=Geobacillus sp. (strain Y412MC10) TaxID=481743 RepID=UPI0011AB353C|nr:SRPBCC family protein [Paenibacillus sp. Y412MC10]
MAHTITTIKISASPDQVWKLIGGFNSLPEWLLNISSSELSEGGRVRHLTNSDGNVIIERLEVFNEKGRYYAYSIIDAPFPVTDYQATIHVRELANSKNSLVEWSGNFTPVGVSDEEVINLFHEIYKEGLKSLQQQF